MQLDNFGVDLNELKKPATERLFHAYVEDWELEALHHNDPVPKMKLHEKYKGLKLLDADNDNMELTIKATVEAEDWLGEHGYDEEFGARPLRRLIQTKVEDSLSDAVLSGQFEPGDVIVVDIDGEGEDANIILHHKEQPEAPIEEALPAV